VVQTILSLCSTYPDAADHLIGIVDTEWEGVRLFGPVCIQLLERRLSRRDSWDTRFRLAFLSYKYGIDWHNGRARQRFENAVNFARNAVAQGDAAAVITDDLRQLAWMATMVGCDYVIPELRRLDQLLSSARSNEL
jgi:hypothetical protein